MRAKSPRSKANAVLRARTGSSADGDAVQRVSPSSRMDGRGRCRRGAQAARLRPDRDHRQGDHGQPHGGVAYERFTTSGPVALLPREAITTGSSGRMTPQRPRDAMQRSDERFLAELAQPLRLRAGTTSRACRRKTFPLVAARSRSQPCAHAPCSSATRRSRCIRSPARASISGCATHSSSRSDQRRRRATPRRATRCSRATPRGGASTATPASRSRTASRTSSRSTARSSPGRAGSRSPSSTRCRFAKRAFTRAMLFGLS